ncbi:MAG: dihydroneopterin aldolase [Verrucomicrobiae bacterium]|nr:dihydroneopterin aldolase [Verrucomicrobiae bacterium]
MSDQIFIDGLQVMTHLGVTSGERASPQMIEVSIVMDWDLAPSARTERLAMTLDYAEVRERVIRCAQERSRVLVETLAENIAHELITVYRMRRVQVEVRKFVFEHTRSVGVRIVREWQ